MAWQRVASINEIDADGVLGVDVDGAPVALYRLGNEVFATAGICTHALAILSDGFVEDGKIECPLHQGQFDIRSGKALCTPVTEDLPTYAVKLEADDVWIDMERLAAFQNRVFAKYARAHKLDFIDVARLMPFDPDLFVDAIHNTYAGERLRACVFFQALVPIVESHLKSGAWPRKVVPSDEPASAFLPRAITFDCKRP